MIEKLLTKIPLWLPHDKCLHAIGGALLFAFFLLISSADIAFCFVVAIGVIKEIAYDAMRPDTHTADVRDALATASGAILGYVIILIHSYRG